MRLLVQAEGGQPCPEFTVILMQNAQIVHDANKDAINTHIESNIDFGV